MSILNFVPLRKPFKNRPLSNLVFFMRTKSEKTISELSAATGFTTAYMNNKLHRNSFSVEQLGTIANYCGYDLLIRDRKTGELYFVADPQVFTNYDETC